MANDVKAQMMHQLAIENATVIARQNAELTALRAEAERLRAALRGLVGAVADHTSQQSIPDALQVARDELAEEKKG